MNELTIDNFIGVDEAWVVAEINESRQQLVERDARIAELDGQLAQMGKCLAERNIQTKDYYDWADLLETRIVELEQRLGEKD